MGSTGPYRFKGLGGYQYPVLEDEKGNTVLPVMVLDDLPSYNLERLPSKKRNQVRKELIRSVPVRPVEDIGEMKRYGVIINTSALGRQHRGDGGYYTDPKKWTTSLEKTLRLPEGGRGGVY